MSASSSSSPATPESSGGRPPVFPPGNKDSANKDSAKERLVWHLRRGEIVRLDEMGGGDLARIVVSDPSVARVAELEDGSVRLIAQAPGYAQLSFSRSGDASRIDAPLLADVWVRETDLKEARAEIEALLASAGLAGLRVEEAGPRALVVAGETLNPAERQRLAAIVGAFQGRSSLRIFDFSTPARLGQKRRR